MPWVSAALVMTPPEVTVEKGAPQLLLLGCLHGVFVCRELALTLRAALD